MIYYTVDAGRPPLASASPFSPHAELVEQGALILETHVGTRVLETRGSGTCSFWGDLEMQGRCECGTLRIGNEEKTCK